MSSELEKAMLTIVQIFHKYSGHKCKLKKANLKDLINNEMSQFVLVSVWDQSYDDVMNLWTGCERSDSIVIQISGIFLLRFMDRFYYQIMQAKYEAIGLGLSFLRKVKYVQIHTLNIYLKKDDKTKNMTLFSEQNFI